MSGSIPFADLALGWLLGAIGILLAVTAATNDNTKAVIGSQVLWLVFTLLFWVLT